MNRVDEIEIEILPGGLIKIRTEQVSEANHASADGAIKHLQNLMGGDVAIARNPNAKTHVHHHHHLHQHVHE